MNLVVRCLVSVAAIVIGAMVTFGVFMLVTRNKRRDLEAFAETELSEMDLKDLRREAPIFLNKRYWLDDNHPEILRVLTDSGRKLKKLEDRGSWIVVIGALVALIVTIVCFR